MIINKMLAFCLLIIRYKKNMKCQVAFKLKSSCKKMRFTCPSHSMDLPNKKNCKKGDTLQVGKQR